MDVLYFALGFGVLMPLIIGFYSYQEKKLKLQREIAMGGAADLKAEVAAMRDESARLRERVAVLERLATDDDRKLSAEISRLRHEETSPRV